METLSKERVIFAIDGNNSITTVKKFLKYMNDLIVTGKCGHMDQCIGYWEGILENSYMMSMEDYKKHVVPMGWTEEQECILAIPGSSREQCYVTGWDLIGYEPVGRLKTAQVKPEGVEAWTYIPSRKMYLYTDDSNIAGPCRDLAG